MTSSAPERRSIYILSLLFFLSGSTALTAEIVLNRLLTYVFGSSHLATSTVLAAYMAGLSAGAWLFGKHAHRGRDPVRVYAALELLVGLFYALLPFLFGYFQRLGVALASPLSGSPLLLTSARFFLSFGLVFAPTLLMGGTLPTLVAAFRRGDVLEKRLPLLYAVNTLGAAAGTLLSTYFLLPWIGLDGALFLCAGVNLFIGIASLSLIRPMAGPEEPEEAPREESSPSGFVLPARAALGLAFAQGFLAFALEVIWFHLIGTVIGVTTYAFALMLFSILLGIGLGSLLLPRLLRRTGAPPASLFIWAMLVAALGVALSLRGWDQFSRIIDWTWRLKTAGHFYSRELVRLLYCLAMLLPTTLALGMSLPALAASAKAPDGRHGAWVGRIFASNTLGTIAGSLFCGFVLLGWIGSERILSLCAALALSLGLSALFFARRSPLSPQPSRKSTIALSSACLACVGLLVSFGGWDTYRLTQGSHYYWGPPEPPRESAVDWLREDAQSGFITVMRGPDDKRTLRTNGKYEGTSGEGEFQDLFALLGGLYLKRYDRALLIGMGPSRTLSTLHAMPFRKIEAVEYSPAIVEAAREKFPEFSRAPFGDTERVSLVCDDGRNHLQLSRGAYDYVAIGISGAAFSGAGNIYSRDFFEVVRDKLTEDGVFLLWIQVHHVYPRDVRSVAFTLRDVFPSVHLYTDPWQSQGFLIASKRELTIDPDLVRQLDLSPRIQEVLSHHQMTSTLELVERGVLTSEKDVSRYLTSPQVGPKPVLLTDLFPAFEYSTPFALAEEIGSFNFQQFSDQRLPAFSSPLDEEDEAVLAARRALAAGDDLAALAALRRAKEWSGSSRYDGQIGELARRVEFN